MHKHNKSIALAGATTAQLSTTLDVMPATPHEGRGLKDMTLPELETIDRGLRGLPEKLEGMSGVCAVLSGLVLTEIKGRCAHKQWTPWLVEHYGKSKRSAQVNMQLADAFAKSAARCAFEPQQLTLALLDDTQSGALDMNHPVVATVAKWTDGRSARQLIADEVSDGRENNPGGFRPNAEKLFAWLKAEYPEHPEYLEDANCFGALPEDVQKRFKAEGERYFQRLNKAARDEISREMTGREWWQRTAPLIAFGFDHGFDDFASSEQLQGLHDILGDFRAQVRRKLDARARMLRPPVKPREG